MTRKILYISGTRADYGLMRSVLRKIHEHPDLSLDIIVTGMHLMEDFGNTIDEIKADAFNYHIVDVRYESDTKESMATFIGEFIQKLTPVVSDLNPDIILLLGDRGEMLAGAIVGAYLSIPVAHIAGGEHTSTVDDLARHAITKLSHIHFPANEESRDHIMKMGENPSRIFIVGAPGLDHIYNENLLSKEQLAKKFYLDFSKPIIIVVQHPVTLEADNAEYHIRETMEAITSLKQQTIIIQPNADAGGRKINEVLQEYTNYPFIQIFKSLNRNEYLSLLKNTSVLIGNSSSGIVEAPSFGTPVINVGSRQRGRQRGANIIDVGYDRHAIVKIVQSIIGDIGFISDRTISHNPYGIGRSYDLIPNILNEIIIDENLLQKK
jgi:UDP-hydrolysing UDP-N-acetyl-D-glucosamine 2-epimerase